MILILYLVLAVSFITTEGGDNSVSKFYEDTYSTEYNCSVSFDQPMFFDCACVTGLWVLYETCSENLTITGDDTARCVRLTGAPISKAVQVVKNREELAVIIPNGRVTELKPETEYNIEMYEGWGLVTGSDWTLIGSSGTKICLSVIEPDSYCFFANTETQLEINAVQKGCDNFDYFIDPQKCTPISGEYENICETRQHRMVKRDANASTTLPEVPTANASTTTTVPAANAASGNFSDSNSTEITEEDEDYEIAQANANNTSGNETDPTMVVADGILDFMTTILDDLLGFHDLPITLTEPSATAAPDTDTGTDPNSIPGVETSNRRKKGVARYDFTSDEDGTDSTNHNPLNLTYPNPVYEFLEISKRITQKTCPPFYVNPRFLNLAVSTFIRLQQVEFKFPETSFKPAGFRRVLQDLRKCEQYAAQFNFTDADCDGRVDGNYTAFGETIELTVTSEYANFERDPIVETVWKVFFNAHSYCFPFFDKILDHHRFTTWMMPLFQNQINDIWVAGKTTENYLNGLFGNQIHVQGNLAYCAVSSRLESNYPFDLPRPNRMPEFGPLIINETSKNAAAGRRRRDLEYLDFLSPVSPGNCLDTSKPLLCPDHVKSIVSQ